MIKYSTPFAPDGPHHAQNTGTKDTTLTHPSRNIIMHHLISFQDNDLEAVMSDYTNESTLVTQDGVYTGTEQIRGFFTDLMKHFPKQKSSFEMDKTIIHDDLVYIVWHANTPSLEVSLGSDTFIIKNGRIYRQTFVGAMKFLDQ